MAALVNIFYILDAIILLGIGVYFLISKLKTFRREEVEIPEDAPHVTNFWSAKTGGYAKGREVKIIEGVRGRRICYFVPTEETDPDKIVKKVYPLVLQKRMRLPYPKNTLGTKELVEYFPPDLDRLPDELKKTRRGKLIMTYMNNALELNTFEDFYQIRSDRQIDLIKDHGGGEISKEVWDSLKDTAVDLIKLKKKAEEEIEEEKRGVKK